MTVLSPTVRSFNDTEAALISADDDRAFEASTPLRSVEETRKTDGLYPHSDRDAQQALLEMETSAYARTRFAKALADARAGGREQTTPYGALVLATETEKLAEAVSGWIEAVASTRVGRPPVAAALLAAVEPRVAAALTLRRLVDRLSKPQTLASAAGAIGTAIEDEARFRRIRDADADAFAELARHLGRNASSPSQRGRRMRHVVKEARAMECSGAAWTVQERELVGLRLIDLAMESTGLVEVQDERIGKKRLKRLYPTEAALEAMRRSDDGAELRPLHEPMIAPPRDWNGIWDGGYLTGHLPRLPLVKTRRADALNALTFEKAPEVFAAVNAAQATGWRINTRILAAAEALDVCAMTAPGAPSSLPRTKPEPTGKPEKDRAELREWRRAESVRRSHRAAFEFARSSARRFQSFDALWFPAQLDFRGRLYFAPAFNPQGPDLVRGLLQFSEAKPLGEEGWKWLAIHLCNCGDFEKMSKAPLAARVEWVLDNEERILTVAADALADDWWMEADSPWQFLAACFEWEGFCDQGETFESRLPVALDGSCSGLQHFSLALRDAEGGKAVNLALPATPAAGAADIYAEVAERANALMQADAKTSGSVLARCWLMFGIDRSVAKRPTMTYGYGARGYGFARMILEDTLAPARADWVARGAPADDPAWPFEHNSFDAATYLSARLTEAIEQVVLKAAETMRWLQHAASLAAASGQSLTWTTPDGFPVVQHYPAMRDRRIKTAFGDTIVRLSVREETAGLDRRLQRQGAAPNYVHSLDACHLRLTVNRAAAEGMSAFALVHDSFAVHAADTPRFFQIVREAMVEMYDREDLISRFRDEIVEQLPRRAVRRLTPPPERGSLDVTEVLDSDFCFA